MPSSSSPEFAADEGGTMAEITIIEGSRGSRRSRSVTKNSWHSVTTTRIASGVFTARPPTKEIVKEPVYDVKVVDHLVTRVAREIRLLEQALKTTNARTAIEAYDQDDAVLGELS
jgi:hypothetical protein